MSRRFEPWHYAETPPGQFGSWSFWRSDDIHFYERGDPGSSSLPIRREIACSDGRYVVRCVIIGTERTWSQFANVEGMSHAIDTKRTGDFISNEATESLKAKIVAYLEATDGRKT